MKNQPFVRRLGFAWSGVRIAIAQERSLRTQLWCALAMLLVLGLLRPAAIWWALCLLSGALVIALELVNTALEQALDRLHPAPHENMRIAKDCAAGAVLCASLGAAAIGALTILVGLGWV
jgi:undecaprenol kinase